MHFDPSPMVSRISPSASWPHLVDTDAVWSPVLMPTGTDTITHTADRLYIFPFFLPIAMALTTVGSVVTTGQSSAEVRYGLFNWNQDLKEPRSLVADFGKTDAEVADQGLVSIASLTQVVEPGWYAFASVADDAIVSRVVTGVDPMIQGNFDVSTTTLVATNYYYATGTGMVAGGITDPGDYSDLTEVTSATDFEVWNPMVAKFNLNPKVPA